MSKRRMILWILPGVAFSAVVFGNAGSPAPVRLPLVGSELVEQPIVRIVGRDHTLTAVSTRTGSRYIAARHDGTLLADRMSLEELRMLRPQLFKELNPSVAGADHGLGLIGTIDLAD